MTRLFYAGGLNHIYRPLYTGGTIICAEGFQRTEFFQWLEKTKPTVFSSPPAAQQFIVEMAKNHRDVISNSKIRMIRSGTAALPSKALRELEAAFGVPVVESYNATEVIGIGLTSASIGHEPGAFKPTVPEIMIMDEKGNQLSQGELGEIAVKGPNVFKGYEGDAEANKAAFINGWFRTGDLGFIDKQGYLHLGGRIKEIINKGGEKVAPLEVDKVLMEHPAVAEAVTFPVPHPTLGEDLNVAVVVRQGQHVTEAELRMLLFQKLTYFKVPTRILFVEEIPKGATGKPSRKEMAREMGLVP
jgi:acyl-coenzyme A synthetase/AMP-(fatty) acid ligase